MGFQSTVVISNDHLHEISLDPDFGRKVESAVLGLSLRLGVERVGHSCYAIESHHVSEVHLVAVGGGAGRDLGFVWCDIASQDEVLLKELARKLGYTVSKKRQKE